MANEVRGILYETITDVALTRAISVAKIGGGVFWNVRPQNLSVNPDFTIGEDKDNPSHVILVTASGAARNSDMKSWRNLGEMQEAKAQLAKAPIVINLYLKSELKAGVEAAAEKLYDVTLHIDKKSYYKPLEAWVTNNISNAAKTKEKRSELLADAMHNDAALASAVQSLADDLAKALKIRKRELDSLWLLMREDYLAASTPPSARTTTVRRGLAKLSVLEPSARQVLYDYFRSPKAIPIAKLPQYALADELDFFQHTLKEQVRLKDDDIRGAIALLGAQKCENVLTYVPRVVTAMNTWTTPLRNLDRTAVHAQWISDNYDAVTNPEELEAALRRCFDDPAAMSGHSSDTKVWVFEVMASLLKVKSKKLQGYGAAELAADTQIPELLKGLHGVFFTPFVQGQKMLPDDRLKMLAIGFSKRFKANVSRGDVPKLSQELSAMVVKENLEDRLIPYRNFEPLLWLLESELQSAGKSFTAKASYSGWIHDFASMGKASATTPFVKVGDTLVHWKTATDAGRGHKVKELSARARSVRYSYDPTTKTFSRRPGIKQLALIVDGTWDDGDLKTLAKAGWDKIVYPDQIAQLVSEL